MNRKSIWSILFILAVLSFASIVPDLMARGRRATNPRFDPGAIRKTANLSDLTNVTTALANLSAVPIASITTPGAMLIQGAGQVASQAAIPLNASFTFAGLGAGIVPIASGGTGQTASSAALAALGGAHLNAANTFTATQTIALVTMKKVFWEMTLQPGVPIELANVIPSAVAYDGALSLIGAGGFGEFRCYTNATGNTVATISTVVGFDYWSANASSAGRISIYYNGTPGRYSIVNNTAMAITVSAEYVGRK